MHIRHEPSCFFTITGFAIHVGNITSWRMSAATSFETSSLIALFLSLSCPYLFCLIGALPSKTLRLCSMIPQSTPVMSASCYVKTPSNRVSSTISWFLAFFNMLASIFIVGSGCSLCMMWFSSGWSSLHFLGELTSSVAAMIWRHVRLYRASVTMVADQVLVLNLTVT